ncbi:MAG: PrsW family intramembrane metalloprotease [Proteobacteria bacterium]|nr:PrsW family intramembrane metalloprotease [Pseudomonadota bacterium]
MARAETLAYNHAMPSQFATEALLGLTPVLLFLAALIYLDSFKLVRLRVVFAVMLAGALAAVLSYAAAGPLMDLLHVGFPRYSRFVAPFVEEAFKAVVIVQLLRTNRIGFLIDAAILGVAAGAGFSLAENVYYAYVFPDADVGMWMVRGLGTAIMHGGVSAVFAVTAQALREREPNSRVMIFVPGFLIAASLHSIFNQFQAWPLASTASTLLVLPLGLLLVFDKSEHEMHNWLIHDYETHEHLLADIENGTFAHSQAGRMIKTLAARFSAEMATNLFAYIKLHTVLVLRAEALLMAKENGTPLPPAGRAEHDSFARLHALEKKIGRTALLTVWPHLKFSRRELFELHQLETRAA